MTMLGNQGERGSRAALPFFVAESRRRFGVGGLMLLLIVGGMMF